ncbi:hypothetical protein PROSTU_00399 [Providencia stuartii ATCC 25827]|uniref:Uncharacterized protein n=1 Tax=Providencia stuartii ATCC 25827 TaxID=471874 RepID=A0AA86YP81_PROST|nr:hypothetical protein PROSTU_00399 [Providencia stuartii ATCC 25827]
MEVFCSLYHPLCIRSYDSISLSYADVSDILAERGIFHHSATYCYFIE